MTRSIRDIFSQTRRFQKLLPTASISQVEGYPEAQQALIERLAALD